MVPLGRKVGLLRYASFVMALFIGFSMSEMITQEPIFFSLFVFSLHLIVFYCGFSDVLDMEGES